MGGLYDPNVDPMAATGSRQSGRRRARGFDMTRRDMEFLLVVVNTIAIVAILAMMLSEG